MRNGVGSYPSPVRMFWGREDLRGFHNIMSWNWSSFRLFLNGQILWVFLLYWFVIESHYNWEFSHAHFQSSIVVVEPCRVLRDITRGKQRNWNREGKQRVKNCAPHLPAHCFTLMAAFLSSFLLVFLSMRCMNTDSACFSWGISKSQFFFTPFFCLMIFVSLITFCYMDWFAAQFWIFIIVLRVWDFDEDIID